MSSSLLMDVQHLTKYYPVSSGLLSRNTGRLRAIHDVSFQLPRGDCLGLVGESGCGKTTVGRTILRLTEPTSGRILFEGQDLCALSPDAMRRLRPRMQLIFQDPFSSLNPRMTLLELVIDAALYHGLVQPAQKQEKAAALLELVGLDPDLLHRYPHELSGGQRQRVGIARALALSPSLVVCDEAVSALDVSIRAQIVNLLADLQHAQGLSYLFISHDLGVVRHLASRVAVMYLGEIVEEAPTESLFNQPRHPYTEALLSAIPVPDPARARQRIILAGEPPDPVHPPPGCPFQPRCPRALPACGQIHPRLAEVGPQHKVACLLYPASAPDEASSHASPPGQTA